MQRMTNNALKRYILAVYITVFYSIWTVDCVGILGKSFYK